MWLVLPSELMTLKRPPQLWQGTIHSSLLPLVPQSKPQGNPLLPPGWTNSPTSSSHTNKGICTSVLSPWVCLITMQIYRSSVIETSSYRSPFTILQIKTGVPWNLQLLRRSVQWVPFKSNTLFVLLTLQIIYQSQTEHDTAFENS